MWFFENAKVMKLVWFSENAKVKKLVWIFENAKVTKLMCFFRYCKSYENVLLQKFEISVVFRKYKSCEPSVFLENAEVMKKL